MSISIDINWPMWPSRYVNYIKQDRLRPMWPSMYDGVQPPAVARSLRRPPFYEEEGRFFATERNLLPMEALSLSLSFYGWFLISFLFFLFLWLKLCMRSLQTVILIPNSVFLLLGFLRFCGLCPKLFLCRSFPFFFILRFSYFSFFVLLIFIFLLSISLIDFRFSFFFSESEITCLMA